MINNRKYRFTWHLVIFCIFLIVRMDVFGQRHSKTVTTSFGQLRGRIVNLNIPGQGVVEEYLGVPYAAAPRFMPPHTAAKWSGVKNATRFQPVCIQMFPNSVLAGQDEALKWMPESHFRYLRKLRTFLDKQQEECLYLNIHVPEKRGNNPQALPVLVLVHGGSFSWGSGNAYNVSVLASYGQMIVVTLNYRLGIFGFLSVGYRAPSCHGNFALGDIAAALQFLRQTIHDFNGDPNQITLLGWDTGAALVNLLMSSPVTAPGNSRIFQRAILMGGTALSSWAMVKNPSEIFSYVAQGLNCPPFNVPTPTTSTAPGRRPLPQEALQWKAESESLLQDMTNCISNAPFENLTNVARNIEPPTYLNVFGPSVDGSIVINDPKHNLEQYSDLFRGLDLMIGLTKVEAYHLLGDREMREGVDRRKRDQIYRTLVSNIFLFHRNEILSAVEDEYTDWQLPTMHEPGNIRKGILQSLSDGLYVSPAINVARLHSRKIQPFDHESGSYLDRGAQPGHAYKNNGEQKAGSTFMYVFTGSTQSPSIHRGLLSETVHLEDLPYILGYPLLDPSQLEHTVFDRTTFTNTDRILSEAMMRYISNFVKTGNPNPSPLRNDDRVPEKMKINWPEFQADFKEEYVEIGSNPIPGSFYRAHEVAFWNKFLPSLERAGQTEANEKHHQFPYNSTFYGLVRPMERYPVFIPPPVPPTPMSPALQAKLQEEKIKNQQRAADGTSTISPSTPSSQPVQESYSTILSVTVAVGCALLTLNILIFAGIYHQWDKHKRFRKRQDNHHHAPHQHQQQAHYEVASAGPLPVQSVNASMLNSGFTAGPMSPSGQQSNIGTPATYNMSSPITQQTLAMSTGIGRMPPAPPPPTAVTSTSSPLPSANAMDNDLHPTLSSKTYHSHHHGHQHLPQQMQMQSVDTPGTPHGVYAEQEPLLNRSFISPTCPRHGKQAAAAAAAAMAAMEEIQV